MASSDEEESPAMQFTRSVRRVASSRQAASPTDSENSTPGALPAVKAPLGINNTPQSAASGYVQRQPRILFSSPISPSSSSKGECAVHGVCLQRYSFIHPLPFNTTS